MFRSMCKSKIHRAWVTECNLNYEGSLTVDTALMREADLYPNEKVQVVNVSNGARLETYVIPGEADSGTVCLNGAAARMAEPGDCVIIISYAMMDSEEARNHRVRHVHVDCNNQIVASRKLQN